MNYSVELVEGRQDEEAEIIFAKLSYKFGRVNACNVYRNSPSCGSDWQQKVETFIQENPADLTVIAGDINAACSLSNYTRTTPDVDRLSNFRNG